MLVLFPFVAHFEPSIGRMMMIGRNNNAFSNPWFRICTETPKMVGVGSLVLSDSSVCSCCLLLLGWLLAINVLDIWHHHHFGGCIPPDKSCWLGYRRTHHRNTQASNLLVVE